MVENYINILAVQATSFLEFFRSIMLFINTGIYSIVSTIFKLFFQITDFTAFDNDMIQGIFNRIFIILGVFMLFKLCVSFISYLVNPEATKDKERGIGKLFGRLITMLLLLFLLIPQANFDAFNDTNTNAIYKSNGLLFGVLYDMQHRLIKQNTIPKLILGTTNTDDVTQDQSKYNTISKQVSSIVHGAFFAPSGQCDDVPTKLVSEAQTTGDFSDIVNYECSNGYYAFEYNCFVALLAGIGLLVIVFLFCFDVAVRMIKLGILRLISPIPAISYIDPKSSKDGMFANYVKTVTSTYLDLFLRLAIIFLVIYIIANLAENNTALFSDSDAGPIAKVIVYIALLFFAGQAPKFIQQALGIKSKGTGLGFGASLIGGALSGMVAGAATGGVWGAAKGLVGGASTGASNQWAAQNGHAHQGSATQEARQRGATLGTGEVDPSKSNLLGIIGGKLATQYKGATEDNINKAKDAMYAHRNMSTKQKDLIEDMRSSNFDAANMTNDQKAALKDAGISLNDHGDYEVTDANGTHVIGEQDVLDRLQNRAMDHNTKAAQEESKIGDAQKYLESRVYRAKRPDVGKGRNGFQKKVTELGTPRETLSKYGDRDDNNIF